LNLNPNFSDVCQLVYNNCKEKPYLVGGKVYRTLIEVMFDYPARSECCDYDFACTAVIKRKKKKVVYGDGSWKMMKPSYAYRKGGKKTPKRKQTSIHLKNKKGCKIDVMNLPDLYQISDGLFPADMKGYFSVVPLSIQAIGMDLEKCEIFGVGGIDSLNERFVWVNNKRQLKNYTEFKGMYPANYIKKKAESIRFDYQKLEKPELKSIKKVVKKPTGLTTAWNWATTDTTTPLFVTTTNTGTVTQGYYVTTTTT